MADATVIAAGMTRTVVVMRAHEAITRNQFPLQVSAHDILDRAFGSADDLDPVLPCPLGTGLF